MAWWPLPRRRRCRPASPESEHWSGWAGLFIQSDRQIRTMDVAFDVDTYLRVGGRLDVSDLDLRGVFADHPLDQASLRCLRYMHDIENHTVCYLRDVLVTKAHRDPAITTFLTMWNYEEHWHGDALAEVLAAHGELSGRSRTQQIRASSRPLTRLRPLAFMLGSALVPDMVAIQMAWGAVNEWTTQAGYARLAATANHPTLTELLRRIKRRVVQHFPPLNSPHAREQPSVTELDSCSVPQLHGLFPESSPSVGGVQEPPPAMPLALCWSEDISGLPVIPRQI